MDNNSLICMNDGQQTRRNSPSVIDLFIVHSSLVPKVTKCETLSHEQVRSDHIHVLMQIDIENETKDNVLTEERWIIKKVDGEKWEKITNENLDRGIWNTEANKMKIWN